MCILFTLTLEGRVNQCFHTLPSSSIHSHRQFIKELDQDFDWYDYRGVYKTINQLRMNPNESIDDFSNIFLHLCYEFTKEYMDWDFFKHKFEHLV